VEGDDARKRELEGSMNDRRTDTKWLAETKQRTRKWSFAGIFNPRGRQQPTCTPGRKGSFAGVFEPTGRQQPTCTPTTEMWSFVGIFKPRREATTNLYAWKERKFCGDLRTHSVATTNLYAERETRGHEWYGGHG